MWESRVLCEISKRLWKSFCDFHRRVISIAVSMVVFISLLPHTGEIGPWPPSRSLFLQPPTRSFVRSIGVQRRVGCQEADARRLRIR
jgi:hypothetical protein